VLFVNLLTLKQGLSRQQIDEAAQRRVRWKYPKAMKLVAEYWLQGTPNIITVLEADHIAPILEANHRWADIFDIATFPTVGVEDGIRILHQAGIVRRRGRRPKALKELLARGTTT
jgi:hypothetical protein